MEDVEESNNKFRLQLATPCFHSAVNRTEMDAPAIDEVNNVLQNGIYVETSKG